MNRRWLPSRPGRPEPGHTGFLLYPMAGRLFGDNFLSPGDESNPVPVRTRSPVESDTGGRFAVRPDTDGTLSRRRIMVHPVIERRGGGRHATRLKAARHKLVITVEGHRNQSRLSNSGISLHKSSCRSSSRSAWSSTSSALSSNLAAFASILAASFSISRSRSSVS